VAVVDDVGVVDGADGAVDSGDGGDDRLVVASMRMAVSSFFSRFLSIFLTS
jgi:hypothetical protein